MSDRHISVPAALLDEMVKCLLSQIETSPQTTDSQKDLNARSNKAATVAITLLRSSTGPGQFSGSQVGEYRVDPTQSSFL